MGVRNAGLFNIAINALCNEPAAEVAAEPYGNARAAWGAQMQAERAADDTADHPGSAAVISVLLAHCRWSICAV